MSVAERLAAVEDRIVDCGGDLASVKVIGVTKGHGVETVREAVEAGLTELGESYAQELKGKVSALEQAASQVTVGRWHFVGRLQRNKVRQIAPYVGLWHSVDRSELGREIAKRASGADVLVQVDATAEPTKGGCPVHQVPSLVAELSSLGLQVRGLMAMGHLGSAELTEEAFAVTVAMADRLELPERSLGMSDDLEAAVTAGSTMVRIGTALFGPRPERAEVEH